MIKNKDISIGILELDYNVPIEVREKVNFHSTQLKPIFLDLKENKIIRESVFICTCNRSLLIFVFSNDQIEKAKKNTKELFNKWSGVNIENQYLRYYFNDESISKLLRLSIGYESAILGEDQILSQIKFFYNIALHEGLTGPVLNRVIQTLIATAKNIKIKYDLSRGRASIPGLVAKGVKDDIFLKNKKELDILIVGWGPISYTIFKILQDSNDGHKICVSNRTLEKINIETNKIPIEDIENVAEKFDVIISMTSRVDYIVSQNMLKNSFKNHLIFDLAVPRNINPNVLSLKNVKLVNIDDLNRFSLDVVKRKKTVIHSILDSDMSLSFNKKMLFFIKNYFYYNNKNKEVRNKLKEYMDNNQNILSVLEKKKRKKILNSINKKIYRSIK